jgi:predicted ABC-type transport system involved in lysophospholipase L1 biosynthesis ATPase subunit
MGKAVVIVTHNNDIAKRAKRLLKMKAGQVNEKAQ